MLSRNKITDRCNSVIRAAAGMAATVAMASACASSEAPQAVPALEQVAPYPVAEAGYSRQAIHLPPADNEADLRVELSVGKDIEVDCNRHWFGGQLKQLTLQGWGYDYFRVEGIAGPVATMMGCPADSRRQAFVGVNFGDAALVRYNSKLPVVVYVPDGFTLQYRIWRADTAYRAATPG